MEPSAMNATRNIFEKMSEIRQTLGLDDGNTKNRVEEWRKKMQEITEQVTKQVAMLDSVDINDAKQAEGDSNIKRKHYFDHIVDTISREVSQIMSTVQMLLHLPSKYDKKRGDDIETSWTIIQNIFENECTRVLKASEDENTNPLELVIKLMNMKDNLVKQVFSALLYRKILIWKDLNIQSEDFVDDKVVTITNLMDSLQSELGYIPTKAILEEVKLDTPGFYTVTSDGEKRFSETLQLLHAFTLAFFEMENLIKTNFKLSSEKREKFTENNPVIATLRDDLEEVHKEKERILEDMRRNESLMMGGERKEIIDLTHDMDKLRIEMDALKKENDNINRALSNTSSALTK